MYARRALLVVTAVISGQAFAQAGSEFARLPNDPKVLIIFDNTPSMVGLPDQVTSLDCGRYDDFWSNPDGGAYVPAEVPSPPGFSVPEFPMANYTYPGTGAPGACDTSPSGADHKRCRNKLCIGKSVMYDALDGVASNVELALGTYYQYLRKIEFASGGNLSTQCEYDVLAAPNEVAAQNPNGSTVFAPGTGTPYEFYPLVLAGSMPDCYATKWTNNQATTHQCFDRTAGTAGTLETQKTCFNPAGNPTTTAPTYADRAFASSLVGPQVGFTNFNNGGTFPTGADSQMLSWANPGVQINPAGTNNYTYYYRNSFLRPPANAGTYETGPFPVSCATTYPTSGGWTTAAGPNGPTTVSNKWRRTDGQWTSTGITAQNLCNATEPCDFTQQWERSTAGGTYQQTTNTAVGTVSTQCAGGATCAQTGPATTTTNGTFKYQGNSNADCSGANASYTGGVLNGNATIPGCSATTPPACNGSSGPCDIAAGVKSGANNITHYNLGAAATFQYDFTGTTGLVNMGTGSTNSYDGYFSGPASGSCPGSSGDNPGTVSIQTFASTPTWTTAPPPVYDCNGPAGTPTSGNNAIRSANCEVTFLNHEVSPDTGTNRCHYRFTVRALTATYYTCQYQKRTWTYSCGTQYFCRWQKAVYHWKPLYYVTRWRTTGGELLGRIRPNVAGNKTSSGSANFCTSGAFAAGSLPGGKCPQYLTGADDAQCGGGRSCRLKWAGAAGAPAPGGGGIESIGGANIRRGRLHNFVNASPNYDVTGDTFNNASANRFCMAPDHDATAGNPVFMANRNPALDLVSTQTSGGGGTSWCWGGVTAPANLASQIDVLADPYSPTLERDNWPFGGETMYPDETANAINPFGDGRNIADTDGDGRAISFSVDGVTWNDRPPTRRKEIAMSWLTSAHPLNNGYSPDTPALNFVPMSGGAANLPKIKAMMSAYDPVANPTGLRVLTPASNQRVTPLYGLLRDAQRYMKEQMDNDGQLACRDYAVIIVTDGYEEQFPWAQGHYRNTPAGFDQFSTTDLVTMVDTLRTTTSGGVAPKAGQLNTYIVGFGDGFGVGGATALDLMARAAGTAIPDNVTGTAYAATSPAQFRLQMSQIFANILQGRFTRSAPIVSNTGDATYFGFYETVGNNGEWRGFLNRYETALLSSTVGTTPTPTWAFDVELNNQAPGQRRMFIPLSSGGSPLDLAQYASWNPAQKAQLQADFGPAITNAAQSDTLVNFIVNPTNDAPFAAPPNLRTSRLGDVFHSTPVVLGGQPPFPQSWAGDNALEQSAYEQWRQNPPMNTRDIRVMIGANDGQLHAICETNPLAPTNCGNGTATPGTESWSFIPPGVVRSLWKMRTQHTFSVDGSFGVADICTAVDCTTPANWSSVLVGGLREGGSSIFALNVTDVNTPSYLWSFYDANLGETWSPPTIARVKTPGGEKWVGFLGGGVHAGAPVAEPNTQGNRVMVVDLNASAAAAPSGALLTDGPVTAKWRIDQNPVLGPNTLPQNDIASRIVLVRSSATSPYVQQAFISDTQGVISRMNIGYDPVISTWAPTTHFDPADNTCAINLGTGTQQRIFDADDDPTTDPPVDQLPLSLTNRHALYQRPLTVKDSFQRNVTYVGTGDTTRTGTDRFFIGPYTCSLPITPADCASPSGPACCGAPSYDYFYAVLDTNAADSNNHCAGSPLWVKRFKQGQKMLSEGTVAGNVMFVPTFIPPTGPSGCNQVGTARIYAFDRTTGQQTPAFLPPVGAPPGTQPSSTLDLPIGIPPPLKFIPDPSDPTGAKGSLVIGTNKQQVNVGTYGSQIRGFRRVR